MLDAFPEGDSKEEWCMNVKRIGCAALLLVLCAGHALAWEAPCVPEPYGWSYEDERRSVVINRVSEDNLTYFVADVQIADASVWKSIYSSDMQTLTDFVSGADAVLAINGDDFGTHRYGVILRNGELLRERDTTRHMLIVGADGNLGLVMNRRKNGSKEISDRLLAENAWQAYEFGPALVENGEALPFSRAFDVISTRQTRKEPRTAIGQISPAALLRDRRGRQNAGLFGEHLAPESAAALSPLWCTDGLQPGRGRLDGDVVSGRDHQSAVWRP